MSLDRLCSAPPAAPASGNLTGVGALEPKALGIVPVDHVLLNWSGKDFAHWGIRCPFFLSRPATHVRGRPAHSRLANSNAFAASPDGRQRTQ
jgi:hypothetical protein